MRVAGLDPSLNNLGMVKGTLIFEGDLLTNFQIEQLFLQESKDGKTKEKVVRKNSEDLERARILYNGMTDFIADIDLVMVEVPVGSQSA